MENKKDSLPGNAGVTVISPFWGFWATTVFGLLDVFVSLAVEGAALAVFLFNYLRSNPGAGVSAALENANSSLGTVAAAATILAPLICLPIIAVIIRSRSNLSFTEYTGLRRFKVKALFFWLAVIVAFLLMSELIRRIFNIPQSQSDVTLYSTSRYLALFFIAVVFFAPLFEEVLFRGFMFEGYANSRGGPVAAIILTAAMWASLHISVSAFDMATIFVAGLLLGLARWKTRSLWITLTMHAFWNTLAFISLAAASGTST